jgi:putative oxidoreductase
MGNQSARVQDWALVILRLGIGAAFILHGYPKLFPAGPGGFAGLLQNLGFPGPVFLAYAVSILEFGGGIAMVLGLFVRYIGVLMVMEMIVTSSRVKMPRGVSFIFPKGTGWELDFLLLIIALALVLLGAGAISLDAAVMSRRHRVA